MSGGGLRKPRSRSPTSQYWSMASSELGLTEEGKRPMRKQSFIDVVNHSPWLVLPSELCLLLDQRQNWILIGMETLVTMKESRLWASLENQMPEDMRWSLSSDVSAGEQLQIRINIS